MTSKECYKCHEIFPIELFEIVKGNSRRNKCKQCRLDDIREQRKKLKSIPKVVILHKICTKCNLLLDVCKFNKKGLSCDGYNTICKLCVKSLRRKEKIKMIASSNLNDIFCVKCKTYKSTCNFRTNSRSKTGYFKTCNACWKPKEWNKEKQHESEKRYREKNPDKLREKYKKKGEQLQVKIKGRIQARIRYALKSYNYRKNKLTTEYLGCDMIYFRKWLEHQFTDSMNWNNFGEWHIDHVIPCSNYDLSNEYEQSECFSWKNLRPCMAHENLEKNDKIIQSLIDSHHNIVINYLKINPLPTLSGNSIEGIE